MRKVVARSEAGARRTRQFDRAQTPYQRLVALDILDAATHARLQVQYEALNPAQRRREIDATSQALFKLASPTPASVTIDVRHQNDFGNQTS